MTKLDYTISPEDILKINQMRLKSNPQLAVLTLDAKSSQANIEKEMTPDDIPEGSSTFEELKKLLHDEAEYQTKPCIIIFFLDTENKQSKAKKQVLCAFKWLPQGCAINKRMVYTTSWNSLKVELGKASINSNNMFEASDWDDIEDKTADL